ncbi:Pyridoxal 5'-phosphate synthase subunit PdxT [uncultured archaeon]|nr:Pyridoxal 5'-phosphate synthase subunit PdxT [uncultured archaeon]
MKVAVIDYGAGNLRSIKNALRKLSAEADFITSPADIDCADAIILPGVGAFGDAMKKLSVFKQPLKDATNDGLPFLGLCLGSQVIFEESLESPNVKGLGLLSGKCVRFNPSFKVPHMGWNNITIKKETPLLSGIKDSDFFYFVHSYYPVPKSNLATAATTSYAGVDFTSVVAEGNIFATQFHPEKSGETGLKILKNFIGIARH